MSSPWYMFCKQFQCIYSITNIPKLRSFQYRLIHGALVLNAHLFRWNKRSDNLCTFCQAAKEDILHLMFFCPKISQLWEEFANFCDETFDTKIFITPENIIFNYVCQQSQNNICNFLCLVTKQYIYRQRCFNSNLSFNELKRYIYQLKNIEKYIAIKNSKLPVFCKKWYEPISTPCTDNDK